MDLNDQFGLAQTLLQALVLALQAGEFLCLRLGLGSALFRLQAFEGSRRLLLTPFAQERRVQAFAAEPGAHLTGFRTSRGFIQNLLLVFGCEMAVFGPRSDLGVWDSQRSLSISTHIDGFVLRHLVPPSPSEFYTKFRPGVVSGYINTEGYRVRP